MSFQNRQEDIDAILTMDIGSEYNFNMCHEGGCEVVRIGDDTWELYELPLYGGVPPIFYDQFDSKEISKVVDLGYSWT